MVVEVGQVGRQCGLEVAAVEDQHPVQQFAADGANPPFSDRIGSVASVEGKIRAG
jgi:hypothetical protein